MYGQHFAKRALAPMPLPVGNIAHRTIPGPASEPLLLRVYTPTGDTPEDGWPILVYFHGGGWVIANLDTYDAPCRILCVEAECVVVSVHYRQAPEHPWPAATEDAFTAYQWVCENARNLQGNSEKVAIGGESAGGNLAAVVSLMARDRGKMLPCRQLLVYPVTDLVSGPNSPSARENAAAKPLNTPMLHWFYDQYAPATVDRTNAYVSPLHAETLAGLPPATVILAEVDPLRSDGEAYAKRLQEAGVAVNIKLYEGVTHEFFGMKGLVSEAGDATDMAAGDLITLSSGDSMLRGCINSQPNMNTGLREHTDQYINTE